MHADNQILKLRSKWGMEEANVAADGAVEGAMRDGQVSSGHSRA